jgi:hypothetical protein
VSPFPIQLLGICHSQLPPTGSNRSDSQTEGLVQLCTSRLRKALATFCPLAGTSPTTALDPLASGHEKDDRVKAASSLLQQLQAASAQLTLSTSEPRSFGTVTLSSGPVASAKEKVPLPTKPQSVADGPTAAPHAQEVTTEEASCGSSELELSPSRPLPLLPCWNLEAPNLPLPPLLPGDTLLTLLFCPCCPSCQVMSPQRVQPCIHRNRMPCLSKLLQSGPIQSSLAAATAIIYKRC